MHVISQIIDGGAIEADGGASAPVGPSVATPLFIPLQHYFGFHNMNPEGGLLTPMTPLYPPLCMYNYSCVDK